MLIVSFSQRLNKELSLEFLHILHYLTVEEHATILNKKYSPKTICLTDGSTAIILTKNLVYNKHDCQRNQHYQCNRIQNVECFHSKHSIRTPL